MGAQVDELVEQIRVEADAHVRQENRGVEQPNGSATAELDRLRANLAVVRRAQDRLPPVTSHRRGRMARFELWIKRGLKRATRWFTWEQTNFNAATSASLANIVAILSQIEKNITDLPDSIDRNEKVTDENTKSEIEMRLGDIERQLRTVLTLIESRGSTQPLPEEQRVCFRQLELQISEAAVVSDRARRNFQAQIDGLARRLDELEKIYVENQSS
jgi:hypothetical protein